MRTLEVEHCLNMIWRLAKTLIYLSCDPKCVSRAQKLKMKHQKLSYFRHYVHGRKLPDDMNKSNVSIFAIFFYYFQSLFTTQQIRYSFIKENVQIDLRTTKCLMKVCLMLANYSLKNMSTKVHSFSKKSVCSTFSLSKQGPFHETYQSAVV